MVGPERSGGLLDMASAWGTSWGTSWGNSWGAVGAPEPEPEPEVQAPRQRRAGGITMLMQEDMRDLLKAKRDDEELIQIMPAIVAILERERQ
jgi:hypothetical protein